MSPFLPQIDFSSQPQRSLKSSQPSTNDDAFKDVMRAQDGEVSKRQIERNEGEASNKVESLRDSRSKTEEAQTSSSQQSRSDMQDRHTNIQEHSEKSEPMSSQVESDESSERLSELQSTGLAMSSETDVFANVPAPLGVAEFILTRELGVVSGAGLTSKGGEASNKLVPSGALLQGLRSLKIDLAKLSANSLSQSPSASELTSFQALAVGKVGQAEGLTLTNLVIANDIDSADGLTNKLVLSALQGQFPEHLRAEALASRDNRLSNTGATLLNGVGQTGLSSTLVNSTNASLDSTVLSSSSLGSLTFGMDETFSLMKLDGQEKPGNSPFSSVLNTMPSLSNANLSSLDARAQVPINIRFGDAGWSAMVAERSAMLASQHVKFAELQLDPPELGPLRVRINVSQDQAQISFVANNAQVRDAMDQTLQRLKELLQEQGFSSVDVDVSDQSEKDTSRNEDELERSSGHQEVEGGGELAEATDQKHQIEVTYGIDYFA